MTEIEGVIKYRLTHVDTLANKAIDITELNAWRTIMHRLQLIGQTPHKYVGLGYGNISQRIDFQSFIISGTQTGHLANLSADEYCIVNKADPLLNKIQSSGPCRPSSEALTHASIYLQQAEIQCIIHVHSSEIWKNTATLKLPNTESDIPYGTPEMATKVQQLLLDQSFNHQGLFTMLGHEDGVVACGQTLQQTAAILIDCLAKCIAIEQCST